MDAETFYDALSWMEIADRLFFIETCDYDFSCDDNIEDLLHQFYDITQEEDALILAEIIYSRIGSDIVCRSASLQIQQLMTIMDVLKSDQWNDMHVGKQLIYFALKQKGVKHASDCDSRKLCSDFMIHEYEKQISQIKVQYNYSFIKDHNQFIHEELISCVYHPSKIKKWIELGYSVDEYLNMH